MKLLHVIAIIVAMITASGCAKSQETNEESRTTPESEEPANAAAPSLDGRTFVIDMREAGKTESSKDTLTFAEGKFRSKGCDQYGFGDATYTVSNRGEGVAFSASAQSETEGRMEWTGTVTGNGIEGTAVWTKEGQAPITYQYSGSVQ